MASLIVSKDDKKPSIITVRFNEFGTPLYASINLNIVDNDIEGGYIWDELVLPEFALSNIHNAPEDIKYNVLVSHIIKAYYDDNRMSAIVNNYIMDQDDEEHKQEFLQMQNIRKLAKETARYIIKNRLF